MSPPEEEVEEARRDAARDQAPYRATFEISDEDARRWEWRCKVCGGTVHDWDEARQQHLDIHGPGPMEEWWNP